MTFWIRRQVLLSLVLWLSEAASGNAFIVDWIWGGEKQVDKDADNLNDEKYSHFKYDVPPLVQYEGKSEDKKFVEEAKKYTLSSQSEFDSCNREVTEKIKSVCSTATEDDLSKLSVNLLNCHSEEVDKGIFPCTEKMMLEECTKRMDTEMWTAYHVMNLKTRVMCYAVRQLDLHDQNRKKVNQLAESAQNQFLTMLSVKEKQGDLEMMYYGTRNVMLKTQDALQLHMDNLNAMHENLEKLLGLKIADLVDVKASMDERLKHFAKYQMDVEKYLGSLRIQLQGTANAKTEEYSEILSNMEKIKEATNSAVEYMDSKLTKQAELIHQLLAERDRLLSMLSKLSALFQAIDWLLQPVVKFLHYCEHMEDKGKLLYVLVSSVLQWILLVCGIVYSYWFNGGLWSHLFNIALFMNLLWMNHLGKDPPLELHHLIAVVTLIITGKAWKQLQMLLKETRLSDKPDDGDADDNGSVVLHENSLGELEDSIFLEDTESIEDIAKCL